MPVFFPTIALSGSVTDDIDLSKGHLEALFVPTVTSGDLLVRGNFDTTSGNFFRIQKALPNTGDLRFGVGVGSVAIAGRRDETWPSFLRLETSVPQSAIRTFTLLVKDSSF